MKLSNPDSRLFTFLSLNCRSLPKHKTEIFNLLIDEAPDALFVTETWLHASSGPDVAMALPDSYAIIRLDRINKVGGGISIIFKKKITCDFKKCPCPGCEGAIFKIILSPNFTFSGALIYRPPGAASNWLTNLSELIGPLAMNAANFTIIGDLNLHLDNDHCINATELIADLASLNLSLKNSGPTHTAGHLLDPIFSNIANLDTFPALPIPWSDHFSIKFSFRAQLINKDTSLASTSAVRKWKRLDINTLNTFLEDTTPCTKLRVQNLSASVQTWLLTAIDSCLPKTKLKGKNKRPPAPWFNDSLKLEKTKCKSAERQWRKSYSIETMKEYKTQLTHYQKMCSKAKAEFVCIKITTALNQSKTLFKIVKELAGSNTSQTPPDLNKTQCDQLATFFVNKVDKIYQSIEQEQNEQNEALIDARNSFLDRPSNQDDILVPNVCDTHTVILDNWPMLNIDTVIDLINTIKSGSPRDPLPCSILKLLSRKSMSIITDLLNISLQEEHVPDEWKHAMIHPLLKKADADPNIPSNFRPISVLPIFAKILEKHVHRCLTDFITTQDLLPSHQSGFRAGFSTETTLLGVTENIRAMIDRGETVALVLLDLSAAFDTVSHAVLIRTLHSLGICGAALNWITSLLENRTFQVFSQSACSETLTFKHGVPQGSILSPLLFNLYMSPLAKILKRLVC
ncbi:uncharacterized protein LOC144762111 [Lissotriton helveticus]